ncbi:MAG: helix-turn-helix domain-containing protein [Actinomycetota bacterium]
MEPRTAHRTGGVDVAEEQPLTSTTSDPHTATLTVSVTEAARLLGIGRTLAYDLVARGVLPSVRLGRRVLIPRYALAEVLASSANNAHR